MIHLTFTGQYAGKLLCNAQRDESIQQLVHASYAPLHNEDYRKGVCPECMKVWADYAYDEYDDMPDYIQALRSK